MERMTEKEELRAQLHYVIKCDKCGELRLIGSMGVFCMVCNSRMEHVPFKERVALRRAFPERTIGP